MKNPIRKLRIQLLTASAALVALTSCSSRYGVHDSGLAHSQSRGATANNERRLGRKPGRRGPAYAPGRLAGADIERPTGRGVISKAGFAATGWYSTPFPRRFPACLRSREGYPDPFFGTNLRRLAGHGARGGGGRVCRNRRSPRTIHFPSVGGFAPNSTCRRKWRDERSLWISRASTIAPIVWLNGERIADKIRWLEPCADSPSTSPKPRGQARRTHWRC